MHYSFLSALSSVCCCDLKATYFELLRFLRLVQAQDARRDHLVEPRLRPRRYRHSGGGGKKADEREGHEPSRPGQGKFHPGSLEMEKRVSEERRGRCERV